MTEATAMVRHEARDLNMAQPEVLDIHRKLRDQTFLSLLRDVYFKGCEPIEIEFCLETCRHLGLDPIAKQIWFIKIWDRDLRREVLTPIIGIAGLRAVAHRTGEYSGPLDPQWCGPDGIWRDVWLEDSPPAAARVAVVRKGYAQPTVGVVTYKAAVQTTKDGLPRSKWRTSPAEMLAKCAEALALRRCFSMEVSANVKVDDVDHYETAEDRRFRVQMTDPTRLLQDIDQATTPERFRQLADAAAELPDGPEKDAIRSAWVEARASALKIEKKKAKPNGKKRGRPPKKSQAKAEAIPESKPEPPPQPQHDYGPPALSENESAEAQEAFGFGDE